MPSYTYEKTFYEYDPDPFLIGNDMNCHDLLTIYHIPKNPKYEYHVVFEDSKTKEKTMKAYSWHRVIHLILHYFIPTEYQIPNDAWKPCLPLPVPIYDCSLQNYVGDQISIYDLPPIAKLTSPKNVHNQNVLSQCCYYLICKPTILPILRYTMTIPSNPIQFKTHCSRYTEYNKDKTMICATSMIGEMQLLADIHDHQKEMIAKCGDSMEKTQKEQYECQIL